MSTFIVFLVVGMGAGSAYAILGLGIVIIYRGSGVVNFAHGAMALVGAGVFVELRNSLPTPVAATTTVALTAFLGCVVQLVVMRPLRQASPVAKIITTLALLTVLQQAAVLRYGHSLKFVPPVLPTYRLKIGDAVVQTDRLLLLGICIVLTTVLALIYRRTRFGTATNAAAENERAAAALGYSPSAIALANWALGCALAGLAGVLLVPVTGLSPTALTLVVVPALAAALIGSFQSFALTMVGGVFIGIVEAQLTVHSDIPGLPETVPFLIIILVLVVRGRSMPLRSHATERLPAVGRGRLLWIPAVVLIAVTLLLMSGLSDKWVTAFTVSAVFGFVALSIVVLTGYGGQLSLAQFAIAGCGALIAGRLGDETVTGLPFVWAVLGAVVLSVPLGVIVGLPALRTRGVSLAIVTAGLAVSINSLILFNPSFTGGPIRGTVVPEPDLFGWDVSSVRHTFRYGVVVVVLLAICACLVLNLRRTAIGRRMIAVRENERGAASLGVSPVITKLYAFGAGAAIASLGGALKAFQYTNVDFSGYDVNAGITAVLGTVVGSVGYVSGAMVGAASASGGVIPTVTEQWFGAGSWYLLIVGLLTMLTMVMNPNGLAHENVLIFRRLSKRPVPESADSKRVSAQMAARAEAADRRSGEVQVRPATLDVDHVSVRFGGVVAVDDVTMNVRSGEIVGLIGPNGAGKSTVVDAITGFGHYSGSIRLDGAPIDAAPPRRRADMGVVRSFQSLELFDHLTVLENLQVASDPAGLGHSLLDPFVPRPSSLSQAALAAIEVFDLASDLNRRPGDLAFGRRRLLAIARAVATEPSVLLLDEPAAGLDDLQSRELGVLVRRLASEWRLAVLLIEHDLALVLETCDRIVVLNAGAVIAQGTPEEVVANQAAIDAYVGEREPAHDDVVPTTT